MAGIYQSPFSTRYASDAMSHLFSQEKRYLTWRTIWIALAKAQKRVGLPITGDQIHALEDSYQNLNLQRAEELEKKTHHDVMAHIHAFEEVCPAAKGILHLGATSCLITDNADLILFREGFKLLFAKLFHLVEHLASFAERHASLATVAYTHFQPAQPTTVGKRACLWLQDFAYDLRAFHHILDNFPCLGAKGATGTQASFLALLEDPAKVAAFEKAFIAELGFSKTFPITGQTYPRKWDLALVQTLSSLAASAAKCATDIRLLSHLGEIEESFADTQVGSSAMPHKRNPIHAERICGLARFLIALETNPAFTAAEQWLERTLDDSSNRRLSLPEAFLSADAILELLLELIPRLQVNAKRIGKNLQRELPQLAIENILMHAVKKGKDRQQTHEKLRKHARMYTEKMAHEEPFDLFKAIAEDSAIGLTAAEIAACTEHLIGLSSEQVRTYIEQEIKPLLAEHTIELI